MTVAVVPGGWEGSHDTPFATLWQARVHGEARFTQQQCRSLNGNNGSDSLNEKAHKTRPNVNLVARRQKNVGLRCGGC